VNAADAHLDEAAGLASDHRVFAELLDRNGPPPRWRRPPSFETITRLVLEQQVSLASANAAYNRLAAELGQVEPDGFLTLDDATLRAVGFSRQKAGYVRGIADLILGGELDLVAVAQKNPDDAVAALVSVRGIGQWTASCFVLFVNGAPDIWPSGDRALYVSMTNVLALGAVPPKEDCDEIAVAWSPSRSTAARMLWHDYLGGRSWVPSDTAGFS
jgi:DNA-3-methyladenine glycosylase II